MPATKGRRRFLRKRKCCSLWWFSEISVRSKDWSSPLSCSVRRVSENSCRDRGRDQVIHGKYAYLYIWEVYRGILRYTEVS